MDLVRGVCTFCVSWNRIISPYSGEWLLQQIPSILGNHYFNCNEFPKVQLMIKICPACWCTLIRLKDTACSKYLKPIADKVPLNDGDCKCPICGTNDNLLKIDTGWSIFQEKIQNFLDFREWKVAILCTHCFQDFVDLHNFRLTLTRKFPQLKSSEVRTNTPNKKKKTKTSLTEESVKNVSTENLNNSLPVTKKRKMEISSKYSRPSSKPHAVMKKPVSELFANLKSVKLSCRSNGLKVNKNIRKDIRIYKYIPYVDLQMSDIHIQQIDSAQTNILNTIKTEKPTIKIKLRDSKTTKTPTFTKTPSKLKAKDSLSDISFSNSALNIDSSRTEVVKKKKVHFAEECAVEITPEKDLNSSRFLKVMLKPLPAHTLFAATSKHNNKQGKISLSENNICEHTEMDQLDANISIRNCTAVSNEQEQNNSWEADDEDDDTPLTFVCRSVEKKLSPAAACTKEMESSDHTSSNVVLNETDSSLQPEAQEESNHDVSVDISFSENLLLDESIAQDENEELNNSSESVEVDCVSEKLKKTNLYYKKTMIADNHNNLHSPVKDQLCFDNDEESEQNNEAEEKEDQERMQQESGDSAEGQEQIDGDSETTTCESEEDPYLESADDQAAKATITPSYLDNEYNDNESDDCAIELDGFVTVDATDTTNGISPTLGVLDDDEIKPSNHVPDDIMDDGGVANTSCNINEGGFGGSCFTTSDDLDSSVLNELESAITTDFELGDIDDAPLELPSVKLSPPRPMTFAQGIKRRRSTFVRSPSPQDTSYSSTQSKRRKRVTFSDSL